MVTAPAGRGPYSLAREGRNMLKKVAFGVLVLSLAGGVARAQEAEDEEVRPQPVRKIKVLENPYDIASFYRSRQGEYFGLASDARYPIAGFYRSRQTTPYGYAPFWNHGYRDRPGGVAVGHLRLVGERGALHPFSSPV